MSRTALVFGGQGSQYVGMGKTLYEKCPIVRDVFDIASSITKRDLKKLCFELSQKEINETINSQICTFTYEMSMYKLFVENKIKIDFTAGFSLGEYSALVAASVLSMEQAFELINVRACAMQNSVDEDLGCMLAINGLSSNKVFEICNIFGYNNSAISNYNSYNQTVVSIKKDVVLDFIKYVKELNGQVIPLKVNRPFHHKMMKKAADTIHQELKKTEFCSNKIPIYSNVTGDLFDIFNAPQLLYEQIYKPVQWVKIIENMLAKEVDVFYEITPKKVISNFVDNVSKKTVKTIYLEDIII